MSKLLNLGGFKSDVERLISDSLKKVNSRLNQEIEFGCDIQFGKTYADIH